MVEDVVKQVQTKMKATLTSLQNDLNGMRGGRASPALVERLMVDYYGQEMEMRQVATISAPEPAQLLIRPYDKSMVKAIEKAIRSSDININPQSEADSVRLIMPPLTRERRQEMVKLMNKRLEDARIAVRNIRRSGNDDLKEFEKEKMISEDEAKRGETDIQKITDKTIAEIEDMGKQKEKEILEV
jgi:ribosome recycling factor